MESEFAYFAANHFDICAGLEPSVLDEVRAQGTVGGGKPVNITSAGVKGLMLAVLEDGIRSYLSTNRIRRDEAEAWITMQAQNWTFSFVTVCQTLGFEPSAVRQALRAMRERNRTRIRRSRPNIRHKGRLKLRERQSQP